MNLHLSAPDFSTFVSSQPKVTAVVQYQAEVGQSVVNCRHEHLYLDALEQALVRVMDWSKSMSGLVDAIVQFVQKGELNVTRADGTAFQSGQQMRAQLDKMCREKVEQFAKRTMLLS